MQQHHPSRPSNAAYPQTQRTYGSVDGSYGPPMHAYSPASASTSPTGHAAHSFIYSQSNQHQGVYNGVQTDHTGMHHAPINGAAPRTSMGAMHDQQQRQYHQQMGTNGTNGANISVYTHQQPQYTQQVPLQSPLVEQSHQSFRSPHENPHSASSAYWNQQPRYHPAPPVKQHLSPLDAYLLARALQVAHPQQETQQIVLFAQSNQRNPNLLIHAYQQNKPEIDELVAQLRREEVSGAVENHSQPYGYAASYPSAPQSSSSHHGTPAHTVVQIPPAVVPLPGAMSGHNMGVARGPGGGMHGMHPGMPTSAPSSYTSFPFHRNHSFSTDRDLASEASSPMLETPTSASLPTSANEPYKPSSAGDYKSPAIAPASHPPPPFPASTLVSSPKKNSISVGGTREGAPYTEEEVRLIEDVVRNAIQKEPEIKMAQLGQLIHERDNTRQATAWSRQLSKRKQAIEKARDMARHGKSLVGFPIGPNDRNRRTYAETDTDGESIPIRGRVEKDDDSDYDDRPTKRRRGL